MSWSGAYPESLYRENEDRVIRDMVSQHVPLLLSGSGGVEENQRGHEGVCCSRGQGSPLPSQVS